MRLLISILVSGSKVKGLGFYYLGVRLKGQRSSARVRARTEGQGASSPPHNYCYSSRLDRNMQYLSMYRIFLLYIQVDTYKLLLSDHQH